MNIIKINEVSWTAGTQSMRTNAVRTFNVFRRREDGTDVDVIHDIIDRHHTLQTSLYGDDLTDRGQGDSASEMVEYGRVLQDIAEHIARGNYAV